MCMYSVPARMRVHMYIHPYIHTYIHPCIHTSIHPYIHTSICMHAIHACMRIHI